MFNSWILFAQSNSLAVSATTMIVVISVYLIMLLLLGWLGHLYSGSGEEDYYLAGRNQGWLVSTLTIMATFLSSFALLGAPGMAYREGVVFALVSLNVPVAGFCIAFLGTRIHRAGRKGNYVTQADMFCDYYQSAIALRLLVPLVGMAFVLPYVIMQIKAGGDVAAVMFGGNEHSFQIGATVIACVMAFYIMVGGMRSVMWADAIQCLLLLGGLAVASIAMVTSFGGIQGFSAAISALPDSSLTVPGNTGMWSLPFLFTVCLLMPIGGIIQPAQWMRFYAARNKAVLRRGSIIFIVVITAAFLFGIMPIGLGGQALYPLIRDSGTVAPAAEVGAFDQILVVVINQQFTQLLGPTLGGILVSLVVVAILAAAMSTADGCLHALSAIVTRDLYDRFVRPQASESERVWVGRGVIFCATSFSLFVVLAASQPSSSLSGFLEMIVELALFAVAFSAQLLPMTIDVLFLRRGTRLGAVTGLIAGLGTAFVFTPLFTMTARSLAPSGLMEPAIHAVNSLKTILPMHASAWGLIPNALLFAGITMLSPQFRSASSDESADSAVELGRPVAN